MTIDKKSKSSGLGALGGGFAGFMLYSALEKIAGKHIPWWVGLILMFICILMGVVFEQIDKARTEQDANPPKPEDEGETKGR